MHISDWHKRSAVDKSELLTATISFFYVFTIYNPLLFNPFVQSVFNNCADTSLNYVAINIDVRCIHIVILNTLNHLIKLLYFKYSLSFIFWSLDILNLFYKFLGHSLYSLISHVRANNIFVALFNCFEFESKKFRIMTFEIYNFTFIFRDLKFQPVL